MQLVAVGKLAEKRVHRARELLLQKLDLAVRGPEFGEVARCANLKPLFRGDERLWVLRIETIAFHAGKIGRCLRSG